MKAYVLQEIGRLEYMDIPEPRLAPGQVLVEVKAAGICGSDIPRIFEQGTYHFPTVPGHEFAGIVRKAYDKEQEKLIGKRVGVFPLIPCMKCPSCLKREYEMCEHYDYLGSRRDGGFAEYVAVPARNVLELPVQISYQEAAMLEPACVGLHALRRIEMSGVASAVVFGPGTIGLLMAQWLRVFGVKDIYIVGTNPGQRQLAAQLGFVNFVDKNEQDPELFIARRTNGQGTDLSIECTGYGTVLANCIELTRRGGDIIMVGNPHGDVHLSKDCYWKILRRQLHVSGTWNSSYVPEDASDDWRFTLRAIVAGRLQPARQITHLLPFEELQFGLDIMHNRSEYYNKVMVVR